MADDYLGQLSSQDKRVPVVTSGSVVIGDDEEIRLDKVLIDTGALSQSYVKLSWVERYRYKLKPYLQPYHGTVRLGDNKTQVAINEILSIPVKISDSMGQTHNAVLNLHVFDMGHFDLIIGLPDILLHFVPLLFNLLSSSDLNAINDDLHYPWTSTRYEEAEEETNSYVPCDYSFWLHYLSMSHEDAVQDVLSQFNSKIDKKFIDNCPEIIDLLKLNMDVFVPKEWEGISGIPPLELEFENMPDSMKPPARPVSERLFENVKKEVQRLSTYHLIPSNSPIASPLTVADKPTPPFCRACGDYRRVNKHIRRGHLPIKNVPYEIERAMQGKVYANMDMSNAFHQVPLAEKTSNYLSIQTPWGLFRPKFLPEGVSPASGYLQKIVNDLFGDFPWIIAIFDNLLIFADDYVQLYNRLALFLARCVDRRVVIKFAKCEFGFPEVDFFGYLVSHGKLKLGQSRKDGIMNIPMPTNLKLMQSFLGASIFFMKFVADFSTLSAPLHEMTKATFDWNRATWTVDYYAAFNSFKNALCNSFERHFPDYSLDWLLKVDASGVAIGHVLLQIRIVDGKEVWEIIALGSKKFSEIALKWDIHKKEAYAIYFGVHSLAYYLRGKSFIIKTDHKNLLWMESSEAPIVIRWRLYLQTFNFQLQYIQGKYNSIADFLSRMHLLVGWDNSDCPTELFSLSSMTESADNILEKVHGGRAGHLGIRRTFLKLNELFPGHKIPISYIADYINSCSVCQKTRLAMTDGLQSVARHLHQPHIRAMLGIDTLAISPPDEFGNKYIIVIKNLFSKLVQLYAVPSHDAITVAKALVQYFAVYGITENIQSDPGSDLTSEVVRLLNEWFGIHHQFSLVGRHESNGVEDSNKEIIRHLSALVYDLSVRRSWGRPDILSIVQFIINSTDNEGTGVVPFQAHFGTSDFQYFRLPETLPTTITQEYLKFLDENLSQLRTKSKIFQDEKLKKRLAINESLKASYSIGDFILFHPPSDLPQPDKIAPKYLGPYEILSINKNDITCKHLARDAHVVLHYDNVKPFYGTRDSALTAAKVDDEQYTVTKIIGYFGNPLLRKSCDFLLEFANGQQRWMTWSHAELNSLTVFENFCNSRQELFTLLFDASIAATTVSRLKKENIQAALSTSKAWLNLRFFGAAIYQQLALPDSHSLNYFFEVKFTNISKNSRSISMEVQIVKRVFTVSPYDIKAYVVMNKPQVGVLVKDTAKTYSRYVKKLIELIT